MSWRRFFRKTRWDRERAEELQSYLQIETDENIARGMPAEEARRAAQRKLGNTLRIREEIYQINTIGFLDSLARDFRYAFRGMRRRPTFTLAVVLTLALGIGANTAIFSVVNGVLVKALPYPNPEELVSVRHTAPGLQSGEVGVSPAMYFTYREENRTFQSIGLWSTGGQSVTGIGDPEQVRTLFVTYGTLQAFGVQPLMGRWFTESDDTPGTAELDPVILTYGYWQRRFGGDASVIGRKMTIDARPSQVVGVMPADFRFITFDPEIILTLRFNRSSSALGVGALQGVARLKPGVKIAEANADVERMLGIWLGAWPTSPGGPGRDVIQNWHIAPVLQPLKQYLVGGVAEMLWVLMGTIGTVLLIACANIANLMLVRSDGRRQEFAVRAALGAGRGRIARELFVESFVLGATGGALGLALAFGGLKLLVAMGPANLPRLQEISVDSFVLAFAAAAALLSSVLFGFIPAIRHASSIGASAYGSRGASASRERHRTRDILVIVQVALALVLLVSAGLMIRTFHALLRVDAGFAHPAEIQTVRIWITPALAREPERFTRMQHEILEKIESIPGVTSAAIASFVPMDGRTNWAPLFTEGRPDALGSMPPVRRFKFVSPGYFRAMGTRMIAGRDIAWTDIYAHGNVAVISESLARELWREPAAAIGKRIHEPAPNAVWREIIGVVEDVHEDGPQQKAPPLVYWPIMMNNFAGNALFGTAAIAYVIRSDRAGQETLLSEVRQSVWTVNPNLPVFLINTMKELNDRSMARTSFALVLLAIAAAMALSLGIIGLYGVISYVVSQRSREIGIRLALGAEPGTLKRMFVKHGLVLTAVGVAIGLGAAVALTRLMSSLLFGIDPLDATTFAVVVGLLVTSAGLASYMPARRAASIDPVVTLKAE